MRARLLLAWALGLLLVAAHLARVPRASGELWLGAIPDELGWRLAWTGLAWGFLLWLSRGGGAAGERGR